MGDWETSLPLFLKHPIMAQIRKFNLGGNDIGTVVGPGDGAQTGKTGGLMIDRLYTLDEINEYLNSVATSQQKAALAGIIDNAIGRDKHTINYNENSNSFSGIDLIPYVESYFGGANRAEKNLSGRSANWANRQARKASDFHMFNSSAALFAGMPEYFKKKKEEADKKAIEENVLRKINDEDGFYGLDENGDIIFLNDFANAESKARYTRVIDALNNGVVGYNLSEWGNDKTLGGMLNWWRELSNEEREYYSADNMWERLANNTADAEDWSFLQALGARKGTNSGSDPDFYVPENSDPRVAIWAKNAGIKFEKSGDRHRIIDPTGRYYNMMGRGVPFLIGTKYEDGAIGSDGMLYTRDEIVGGQDSEIGLLFDSFGSVSTQNLSFKDWLAADKGGIKTMWDKDISGFDNAGYQFYNYLTHHTPDLWGDAVIGWTNGEFALRDDTPFYESDNPEFQVINYIVDGEYDELGFPKTKFRVIYKDRNNNNALMYKDYDSEEAMLNDEAGVIRKRNSRWTPKSKTVSLAELKTIGSNRYYVSETVELKGGVRVEIYRKQGDTSGTRYYLDGEGKPQRISDSAWKKLKNPAEAKKYSAISVVKRDGGTIPQIRPLPKYYTGGAVRHSGLTITEAPSDEAIAEGNPESKTHTMTNTGDLVKDLKTAWKYDFTDAEKLQIEGAIVDLAGVAISFIPGAHLASAATGLVGTGMTFWGDVKKDGLDWGDIGRGLLSLAMDVGTVFTGGFAKTAKVIKAVKAAAKPIMKLLTAAGITHGIAALSKLARGEDVSSEDLIDILRGITSTAIGSKMLKQKVGDVQLAKRIEKEVLKTQNADIKDVPKAKIEGKNIQISNAEVNANIKGKTKAEVEAYLQTKVKQELGDSFDASKHGQNLSEKFGIEYDKGERNGFKLRNLFKRGESVIQRGDGIAKFTPQKPKSGSWWINHFLWPSVRNQYLGYDRGFWQSNGRLSSISRAEFNAARARLAEGSGPFYERWADQALMQHSMTNPNAFSFEFEPQANTFWIGLGKKRPSHHRGFSWGRSVYGRTPQAPEVPKVYPTYVSPTATPKQGPPIMIEAPTPEAMLHYRHQEVAPIRTRNAHSRHQLPEKGTIRLGHQSPLLIEAPTSEAMLHYRHQQAVPVRTEAAYARHQVPEQGPINLYGGEMGLTPVPSRYVSVLEAPTQPIRSAGQIPLSQAELASVNSLVTNYAKIGGSPDDVYSYVAQMLYSKGYRPTSQLVEQVVNAAHYTGYLKKGGKIQYSKRGSVLKCSGGTPLPDDVLKGRKDILYKMDGNVAYQVDTEGKWKFDPETNERIPYDLTIRVSPGGIWYRTDTDGLNYEVNEDGTWKMSDDGTVKVPFDEAFDGGELEGSIVTAQRSVTDPQTVASQISLSYANPIGSDGKVKTEAGLGKPLGKTAAILSGYGLAHSGLAQQKNNVDQLRVPFYTTESEIYTPYRNPASSLFEQEKRRIAGRARYNISSDPNKNWAFRQSDSDNIHRLTWQEIENASEGYNNWLKTNTEERRYYAANRSNIHNAGVDASQKLDTTKAAYDSKLVGENVKNLQLAATDLANTWNDYESKKGVINQLEFEWDWQDWREKVAAAYAKEKERVLTAEPNKTFPSINEWIQKHPIYGKEYKTYVKRSATLKKGGKIRPLHEQLQIDSAKARDKELIQLSKQAHALLKTLLS